jgi:hypothetical protein
MDDPLVTAYGLVVRRCSSFPLPIIPQRRKIVTWRRSSGRWKRRLTSCGVTTVRIFSTIGRWCGSGCVSVGCSIVSSKKMQRVARQKRMRRMIVIALERCVSSGDRVHDLTWYFWESTLSVGKKPYDPINDWYDWLLTCCWCSLTRVCAGNRNLLLYWVQLGWWDAV